jgi:hypothetical protein
LEDLVFCKDHKTLDARYSKMLAIQETMSTIQKKKKTWSCSYGSIFRPRDNFFGHQAPHTPLMVIRFYVHLSWSYGSMHTSISHPIPCTPLLVIPPHTHLTVIFIPTYNYLGYPAPYPLLLVIRFCNSIYMSSDFTKVWQQDLFWACVVVNLFVFTHK